MCGIAGFVGFQDDALIKKISTDLTHRGPDGAGFYISQKVTLLNRRLAIIDLKGGDQPIYNEDQSVVVVYNGEIYSYQELKKTLSQKGHIFKTNSDTEVIVHGYEEWGDDFFDQLNGMFAIALYDIKKDKLLIVRDQFGIKPLYFSQISPSKLIFSSEIKPIIYSGLIEKVPNDKTIYRYLKFRIHDDSNETFFSRVNRLLPGEMIIVEDQKIRIKKYSHLEKELSDLARKKVDHQLEENDNNTFQDKLIDSIRRRLVSDVPVGTCLSGGLDSSTVVSVVNSLLLDKVKESSSIGKKQKSFSAIFPNSTNNEEIYINELVKTLKYFEGFKVRPTPEEFFKELNDFVYTQEEPTISSGPYAQYKVMQEAHGKVKVLLDGQGADEMMAGYLPYYFVYFRQLLDKQQYFRLLKELVFSTDILFKFFLNKIQYFLKLKNALNINQLLKNEFSNHFKNEKFIVTNNNLKNRLIEDIFKNSLQSLLRYEDKNSMRFSIEGRVPFLDLELIKYIFSNSDSAIINNGWNKNILRRSMSSFLPSLISKRRNKIGFTTPEYEWFIKMKNRIYQLFMSESFINRKYFNQKEVVMAFEDFIRGKNEDTMIFWRLLNLELWLQIFIDPVVKTSKIDKKSFTNQGKNIEIKVQNTVYNRFPIKTELVKSGDNLSQIIIKSLQDFNATINNESNYKNTFSDNWFLVISEKIVAISQGRSYFIWDIKPSLIAKILANFVTKTPFGIGLGSAWTMQLAINEVGVIRIIAASVVAMITKPFGVKGMFYKIVGPTVRSIDGPTEYSLYPSNVSAKLGPKNPDKVALEIHQEIIYKLKLSPHNFLGVVIIDANDIGRNVLGNSTNMDNTQIEKIFADNPMGQAAEQTPLVVVSAI